MVYHKTMEAGTDLQNPCYFTLLAPWLGILDDEEYALELPIFQLNPSSAAAGIDHCVRSVNHGCLLS